MFVFIDDSGDTGLKFDAGSSREFVVACCVFQSAEDVAFAANRIKQLRSEMKWHPNAEFKFSKSSNQVRALFLKMAAELPFTLLGVKIHKESLSASDFGNQSVSMFLKAIDLALVSTNAEIKNAKVFIDGQSSKRHKSEVSKFLKSSANQEKKIIEKVRFVDSKSNDLIQLADMLAGTLRRISDLVSSEDETSKILKDALRKIVSLVREYPG